MKKTIAVLLSVMLLVVFAVSCSSPASTSSDAAAESTSSQASQSSEPAQSEESQPAESAEASSESGEDALQKIKDSGKIIMLTNATFPPYEYRSGEDVAGTDVDIMQEIADEIGVELEVVDMDFDATIPALQTGKGDVVAAGMTITEERAQAVDFSVPYTDATQLIIVPKGSEIASADDFEGTTIGVQLGTTGDTYITWEIEDGANIEVVRYKSNMEASMDLVNGRLDAIVLDELPAKAIVEANPDDLELITEPFTEEQYAFAVAKGNQSLLDVINSVLERLVEEGKVIELNDKHVEAFANME